MHIFWTGLKYLLHAQTHSTDLIRRLWMVSCYLLNSTIKHYREKKRPLIVQTVVQWLFFSLCLPCVNRTCSICCLGSNMDAKTSRWRWRGDGKIISVAEEKFPLCEISDKHTRPQPQNNVDQRSQTSGAMRLQPLEQRYLFIFFQDYQWR